MGDFFALRERGTAVLPVPPAFAGRCLGSGRTSGAERRRQGRGAAPCPLKTILSFVPGSRTGPRRFVGLLSGFGIRFLAGSFVDLRIRKLLFLPVLQGVCA